MRILFTCVIIVFATAVQAQTTLPGSFQNNLGGNAFAGDSNVYNSGPRKKWFISSYSGFATGYNFFQRRGTPFMAAPLGLQLNRRLSNNVYAFAGVTAAPTYHNFNHAFLTADANKLNPYNGFYQPANFSMYSAASLGLMYINNARTFSVSGSIGVERNSYPFLYNNQFNTTRQNNTLFFSK
ncbi:hypothetical protein FW778_21425 [Ginsengibacter hankyongi]|uniref:Outer membrane protein beta-barrel domain-containing protein n=1 Tax=Ginsengibacter hankyongi TaxID=2607284 RepID=A0A5J5IAI3_9BACT|nr:hypothetical protein [Ginsengibacter hankyongi]KAA9035521.1 hypothetical protein FW778_21425 [Ginsengibacter hankyongi]